MYILPLPICQAVNCPINGFRSCIPDTAQEVVDIKVQLCGIIECQYFIDSGAAVINAFDDIHAGTSLWVLIIHPLMLSCASCMMTFTFRATL